MKHFYEKIDGWFDDDFRQVYLDAVANLPQTDRLIRVAEVGCWLGRSTAFMAVELLNTKKRAVLYCIDHWQGSPEELDVHFCLAKDRDVFQMFLDNMRPAMGTFTPLKMSSVEAAAEMAACKPPRLFDFVFIDASHTEDAVRADLAAWWPLVRPGGRMAGHDFDNVHPGVQKAVREFFGEANFRVQGTCWIIDKPRE